MSAFDQAFAASKANMANIDLGHYVAGTGESPIPFLRKFHDRIASVHLKDRQTPAHGAGNLPWGTGDTPLKEILQVMHKEKYQFPASISSDTTCRRLGRGERSREVPRLRKAALSPRS
jgi:sugar phosphate isomerase/epimerase